MASEDKQLYPEKTLFIDGTESLVAIELCKRFNCTLLMIPGGYLVVKEELIGDLLITLSYIRRWRPVRWDIRKLHWERSLGQSCHEEWRVGLWSSLHVVSAVCLNCEIIYGANIIDCLLWIACLGITSIASLNTLRLFPGQGLRRWCPDHSMSKAIN